MENEKMFVEVSMSFQKKAFKLDNLSGKKYLKAQNSQSTKSNIQQ